MLDGDGSQAVCPSDQRPAQAGPAAARLIGDGRVIAWYRGRMEFGPRALGHRSILADPGHPEMRDRINAMVKMREAFRPFAPAVSIRSEEHTSELQSQSNLVCRLLLEKKKTTNVE